MARVAERTGSILGRNRVRWRSALCAVENELRILKALLNKAAERRLIAESAAEHVSVPRKVDSGPPHRYMGAEPQHPLLPTRFTRTSGSSCRTPGWSAGGNAAEVGRHP